MDKMTILMMVVMLGIVAVIAYFMMQMFGGFYQILGGIGAYGQGVSDFWADQFTDAGSSLSNLWNTGFNTGGKLLNDGVNYLQDSFSGVSEWVSDVSETSGEIFSNSVESVQQTASDIWNWLIFWD